VGLRSFAQRCMVVKMKMHNSHALSRGTGAPAAASLQRQRSASRLGAAPAADGELNVSQGKLLRPSGDAFASIVSAITAASATGSASLIVEFGFLTPLLHVLSSCTAASEAVQVAALRGLAHIASHRENHAVIRNAGILPTLMRLITESETHAIGVLEVLRPLARDPEMKDMLRTAGAFRPLIKLVHQAIHNPADPQPLRAAEAALGVIKNLATSTASQEALRNAGAIKALTGLLDVVPPSCTAAIRAATALSNLSVGNQKNRDAIREGGGITRLALLVKTGGEAAAAATEALGNLAVKNSANKDAIREAGGVQALAEQYIALGGALEGSGRHAQRRPAGAQHHTGAACSRGASSASSQTNSRGPSRSRSSSPTPRGSTESHPSSQAPSQPNSPDASPPSSRCASPPPMMGLLPTVKASGAPPPPLSPTAAIGTAAPYSQPPALPTQASAVQASARVLGAPSPPCSARPSANHHGEVTMERTAWALRNLTAASGLNTAILAACAISLKGLEAACKPTASHNDAPGHGGDTLVSPQRKAVALTSVPARPPPPPQPTLLPLYHDGAALSGDENDDETKAPRAGVALTLWSKTGRAW